jgi:hypothetical protein
MFDTTIKGRGYRTKPYSFDECVSIQLELGVITGSVAGPVVEFAAALFTVGDDGKYTLDPSKTDNASGETLGRAVSNLPAGIIKAGGAKFVRRVLAQTYIEVPALSGKAEDPPEFVLLSSPSYDGEGDWFDAIYTGGNSAELFLALGWVLTTNFSPFGRTGSWTWSSLFSELMSAIPQLKMLSIETTGPSGDGKPAKTRPTD